VTTVTPPRQAAEEVRIDEDSKSARSVNAFARREAVLAAVCVIGAHEEKHEEGHEERHEKSTRRA
jgi:hypothetical protein